MHHGGGAAGPAGPPTATYLPHQLESGGRQVLRQLLPLHVLDVQLVALLHLLLGRRRIRLLVHYMWGGGGKNSQSDTVVKRSGLSAAEAIRV